jgi:hypothetical protein
MKWLVLLSALGFSNVCSAWIGQLVYGPVDQPRPSGSRLAWLLAIVTGMVWLVLWAAGAILGHPVGLWVMGVSSLIALSIMIGCTRNPAEEKKEDDELARAMENDDSWWR